MTRQSWRTMRVRASVTLDDACTFVAKYRDEGCICPCCKQVSKVYRRPLNRPMTQVLLLIYGQHRRHPDVEWIHVEDLLKSLSGVPSSMRGDFAKLKYWGLIEPHAKADDGNSSGLYKITRKGRRFCRGVRTVPSHMLMYNAECIGFSGDEIDVTQALKVPFDYAAVLNTARVKKS